MRPVCSYTDFFVLATGQNPRQTKAIWDEVHDAPQARRAALLPRSVAGEREGRWIVGDYLDVVFHVFTPDSREYYRLEELWGDVPASSSPRRRPSYNPARQGAVAQLGERLAGSQKVTGSSPVGSISTFSTRRAARQNTPVRFRKDARLDPSQVEDRRGGGGMSPARRRSCRRRRRRRARRAGDLPADRAALRTAAASRRRCRTSTADRSPPAAVPALARSARPVRPRTRARTAASSAT